jgi:arsenate reductase (glutaredoxin)
MITLYHNPDCSKSREALKLAQQFAAASGQELNIIDYLRTPPTLEQLRALHRQLNRPVQHMVRNNEEIHAVLNLTQASDEVLLQALVNHPQLLQRPIAVYHGKAMIGRPPESLAALFQT